MFADPEKRITIGRNRMPGILYGFFFIAMAAAALNSCRGLADSIAVN